MTMELRMLAWATALGLVHILVAAALATGQRGLRWNVGNRDGAPVPLAGAAARAARASANFLETFPLFAAAVLAAFVARRSGADTARGAQLYLWARVAYLPIYAAGIPYLRSAVWAVSMVGLLLVLAALL